MTSTQEPAVPADSDVRASLGRKLAVLEDLDGRPLAEHADVYQQLHAELQGTLAEIDSA
jgi:hypothetical protein